VRPGSTARAERSDLHAAANDESLTTVHKADLARSLNNQCELWSWGIAAGQHSFVDAQGQSGLGIKKQRGEVSDPFGTVCPLSAVPS